MIKVYYDKKTFLELSWFLNPVNNIKFFVETSDNWFLKVLSGLVGGVGGTLCAWIVLPIIILVAPIQFSKGEEELRNG